MHLEPDSVILRDPTGKQFIQVLEQNYRADPLSESLLLSLFEGKTIDFLAPRENKQEIVPGKIIRSGYVPHSPIAMPPVRHSVLPGADGAGRLGAAHRGGRREGALRPAGNAIIPRPRQRHSAQAYVAMAPLHPEPRTIAG